MKKYKILILFVSFLFLTGCSSYTELNELGIVDTLGIDYTEKGYHLYINITEGNQEDGTLKKDSITYDAESKTIQQAFHQLYLKSNKKIYLSHMNTLLLSEKVINQHLKDVITYLLNQRDIRNNFHLIQMESDMKEVFSKEIEAKDFNELIKMNEQYMGTTKSITFEQFLEELLIDQNTYLPLVKYKQELEIQGLSLIKDFKVFDVLSPNDTILLNILNNNIHQSIYHDTTIYKNQTVLEYQKNQVTFHIQMEVNDKDTSEKKQLEEDLKELLTSYQEQGYDLIKLVYQMKQNHLFSFNEDKILLNNIHLKFQIHMNAIDNYLERSLPL